MQKHASCGTENMCEAKLRIGKERRGAGTVWHREVRRRHYTKVVGLDSIYDKITLRIECGRLFTIELLDGLLGARFRELGASDL